MSLRVTEEEYLSIQERGGLTKVVKDALGSSSNELLILQNTKEILEIVRCLKIPQNDFSPRLGNPVIPYSPAQDEQTL